MEHETYSGKTGNGKPKGPGAVNRLKTWLPSRPSYHNIMYVLYTKIFDNIRNCTSNLLNRKSEESQ